MSLGSTTGGGSFGQKVGINQIVWDPATNTLHVESDDLLDQHTRYAVIVTDGILDAGWSGLVTVDSAVQNKNAAGEDRINVQTADEKTLTSVKGISAALA